MKRAFDILAVAAAMPLWLPLLLVTAAAARLVQGRPVFFRQERAGRGGKPFRMLKIRTMREGEGTDAERLTRFGSILRRTSLDELPELFHVLGGTMSLVGPRPLPVRYLPRYSKTQARRHEVRPGITGLAQVRGRNALDWDEKLRLDVEYVDSQSFTGDLKILLATVRAVLGAKGVAAPGQATMEEFRG